MKKNIVIVLLYLVAHNISYSQFMDMSGDYRDTIMDKSITTGSSIYGNCFTPRGEFKILIICVNFDNPNDPNPNNPMWPANSDLPACFQDNSFIFSDLSTFDNIPAGNKSISNYFYEMSKHLPENERFKLYAEFYPVEIELDPSVDNSWSDLSRKAYAQLEIDHPNFVNIVSNFDNRDNYPQYVFDNTPYFKDNEIDYVVITFRFSHLWGSSGVPFPGMLNWSGSRGSYNRLSSYTFDSIRINGGHTHPNGLLDIGKAFAHEFAHNFYNAMHYGSANKVLGPYLSSTTLWGIMPLYENEIFACANGWERWYLGYISIKHDLKDVSQNGTYTLRDYMTYGDVMRIKMPYVDDQYIWLENHQGVNVFDERMDLASSLCGNSLSDPPKGLMIYTESITDTLSEVKLFSEGANGLKLIHADGNYDHSYIHTVITFPLCNSTFHPLLLRGKENPYTGYNTASKYLYDIDDNDTIQYTTDGNTGPQESSHFWWLNGNFIYGNGGSNAAFGQGDKIGIGTNPPITNMQKYDRGTNKLDPIYLNGISIEVLEQNANGDIDIEIKFDDYNFNNDIRMCGNIFMPPADIYINNNIAIEIDKSGTPNRILERNGEFVNPSIVSSSNNTDINFGTNSSLVLKDESAWQLFSGSHLEINDISQFKVNSGTTLLLKSGSSISIKGSGRIEVEPGGYICMEDNVSIDLQDELSVINLHTGYNSGVNTDVIFNSPSCIADPSAIINSGNGHINSYDADIYIQNKTFGSDKYYAGQDIYVGEDVTSQQTNGPVLIQSGAEVILDADGDVVLDTGFELEYGGMLEIR